MFTAFPAVGRLGRLIAEWDVGRVVEGDVLGGRGQVSVASSEPVEQGTGRLGQHAAQVAGQCAVPVEEPEVFVGLLMALGYSGVKSQRSEGMQGRYAASGSTRPQRRAPILSADADTNSDKTLTTQSGFGLPSIPTMAANETTRRVA
ncbi:hypothetical protein O7605_20610 [Verrucosispora sp. WMMA2121]|uniref:hypothetical protein n=1 Tax=Verrucosispora sp. WMMA2121 TaxID=3015164 RepID=UPI0022B5FBC4|nr:hypothetical protein [Verrucosispora sp. WMMA2121]MCZ7421905.1 hypothetical protein [Verrucosispora sp. WMMA2121]